MKLFLGCIADDYTGASDLANTLAKSGLRTLQLIGLPEDDALLPDVEAVVIALKTRSNPASVAVEESLNALCWLQEHGARQFFFKYCSTFDSTTSGNIGPVMDALMKVLGSDFIIACPAFPSTGRTVYQGHLFVHNELLSDSHMQNHPLTPMKDSNLVRFLGKQTEQRVGLIPIVTVEEGPEAIYTAMLELQESGVRIAIVDAYREQHLLDIGVASKNLKLITGGSAAAMGLASNFLAQSGVKSNNTAVKIPSVSGPQAVISGSCSQMTLDQVAQMSKSHPVFRFDAIDLAEGRVTANKILEWASPHLLADQAFLVTASVAPELIRKAQELLGRSEAGELIEKTLAEVARLLVKNGVRRMLVAGGETSGAVVQALGIRGFQIGQEIAPGVPCLVTLDQEPIALTLKSGNFGNEDFFLRALREMP